MYKIFLPSVYSTKRKFVGTDRYMPTYSDAQLLKGLGTSYLTIGNFLWSELEYNKSEYNETLFSKYKLAIDNVLGNNITPLACIHSVPDWAISTDYATEKFQNFAEFFGVLTSKLEGIEHWQIFNEVDSRIGFLEHYGGWGSAHLKDYINLLKSIQNFRGKFKLSVSLMMEDDSTWYADFAKYGGNDLIDYVNFHFYPHWRYEYGQEEMVGDIDLLKKTIDKLRKAFNKPIRLTETNLLFKGLTNPAYEQMKALWIYSSSQVSDQEGLDAYLVYAYKSGWNNANFAGLPAQAAYQNICGKYNK
jgi:hypothetical protein